MSNSLAPLTRYLDFLFQKFFLSKNAVGRIGDCNKDLADACAVLPWCTASLRVIDLLNDGSSTKVPHTRDSFSPIGFVFFEVKAAQAMKVQI